MGSWRNTSGIKLFTQDLAHRRHASTKNIARKRQRLRVGPPLCMYASVHVRVKLLSEPIKQNEGGKDGLFLCSAVCGLPSQQSAKDAKASEKTETLNALKDSSNPLASMSHLLYSQFLFLPCNHKFVNLNLVIQQVDSFIVSFLHCNECEKDFDNFLVLYRFSKMATIFRND